MEKKHTFFFEIFSEEIPAKMQKNAISNAGTTIKNILDSNKILYADIESSCATRRLFVYVSGIEGNASEEFEEKRGPKTGSSESAINGFLRTNNLETNETFIKDGYVCAKIKKSTFEEKIPTIFQEFVKSMPWPKSMHWFNEYTKGHTFPWVRPVRSICCLLDDKPIEFEVSFWGLKTGNTTLGHRFLSNEKITVKSFEQYKNELEKNFVIVDYDNRKNLIIKKSLKACDEKNISIKDDESLLNEVTGLVDFPYVVTGDIAEKFMKLPDAVLATSMRVHQKYFSTYDADGKIAPFFVALSNQPDKMGLIKSGFEKVLKARLSDAEFFYNEDLKKSLESRLDFFKNIVFHEKLDSLADKIFRLENIYPDKPKMVRAARLCKLDLVTEMVKEFDELQGVIGAHYAFKQGEPADIVKAIEEHYYPIGQNGALPQTNLGTLLAIADKVDSLVGFIGVNIKPTGSKDPTGLRRLALGIIRIIENNLQNGFEIDLKYIINRCIEVYQNQKIKLIPNTKNELVDFLFERLGNYLKQKNRFDIIKSVTAKHEQDFINSLNVCEIISKVNALNKIFTDKEKPEFMELFKRLNGFILEDGFVVDENLLKINSEKEAYEKLIGAEKQQEKLLLNGDYLSLVNNICSLSKTFLKFIDDVQINSPNEIERKTRIAILSRCKALFENIADFTKLQE